MNQENTEPLTRSFAESHPWLALAAEQEDDSVEEVIRYVLDEIRYA